MYTNFHIFPSFSPSFPCFEFFLGDQLFEDLIQAVCDFNLQSFFYDALYDAASMINYSKEPLDAIIVDNPPPKPIFAPHCRCQHSKLTQRVDHARHCGQTPPLGSMATWCLINSFGWTFDQHQICPSSFLPIAQCSSMLTLPRPSHILRYAITYAKLHFVSYVPFVGHRFRPSSSN